MNSLANCRWEWLGILGILGILWSSYWKLQQKLCADLSLNENDTELEMFTFKNF